MVVLLHCGAAIQYLPNYFDLLFRLEATLFRIRDKVPQLLEPMSLVQTRFDYPVVLTTIDTVVRRLETSKQKLGEKKILYLRNSEQPSWNPKLLLLLTHNSSLTTHNSLFHVKKLLQNSPAPPSEQ